MGAAFLQVALSALNCFIGVVNVLRPDPNPWVIGFNFAVMLFCGLSAIVIAVRSN
jgi:hypothetical protein